MNPGFWRQKWARNEIAFHKSEANPALVKHFSSLALSPGARVFVPLCGKTLDIAWLLTQGYPVAGAELVETAIAQLFDELGVEPTITPVENALHYRAQKFNQHLDIFVGDVLELSAKTLGPVDAVYDRAALVALPQEIRDRYTQHLVEITAGAPQLLVAFDYDPALMSGPPFAISAEEVERQYGDRYALSLLERYPLPTGLKGNAAQVNVWKLG